MRKLRVGGIILALIFAFTGFLFFEKSPVRAAPAVWDSGTCGTNATWTLYSDGVLTISGRGPMDDPQNPNDALWIYNYQYSINRVVIEDGITHIGDFSFYGCGNLTSVSIADSVTSIGRAAFYDCYELSSISIPQGVTSMGISAFYGTGLQTVTLPSGLKVIPIDAFRSCPYLTSVTMSGDVTTIGDYAFYNCVNLTNIELPEKLESLGEYALAYCPITSVVIPKGITEIPEGAFESCDRLSSVTLHKDVTSIGRLAFSCCTSLQEIDLPDNLDTIGEEAFYYCSLTSIVIPQYVTEIPTNAFNFCQFLSSITLPDNLEKIGGRAFEFCIALTDIDIPDTVTEISPYAFVYSGLSSFTFPSQITVIPEGVLSDCYDLEYVGFKGEVIEIEAAAFARCRKMTSIELPESLVKIGEYAFGECSGLKSVTIPKNVRRIESEAFYDCYNVTDVYCYPDPDDYLIWKTSRGTDFNARSSTYSRETVCHVPPAYYDYYQEHHLGINVLFVGDLVDMQLGEHLAGYSLSLEGDIRVNFFMYFDDLSALSNKTKVVFTIRSLDGANSRTQEVYLYPQGNSSPYARVDNSLGRTHYVFSCHVSAKEMTSQITAQIVDGSNAGSTYTYSVQDYAKRIIDDTRHYDSDVQYVVQTMLNYGTAAQIYFNYNTSKLANDILPDGHNTIHSLTASDISSYEYHGSPIVNADIRLAKANLVLQSEITMNLYFTGAHDGTVFKCNGVTLPTRQSGEYTIVSIKGIYVGNLEDDFPVSVYSSDGGNLLGSVTYSPKNYCYNVIARDLSPTRTQELKDAISALYYFDLGVSIYKD